MSTTREPPPHYPKTKILEATMAASFNDTSSDQMIQSLQQQLEDTNEQVFDLSLTVSAIEMETQHRIETIQQETSQQVRLLQEQLRRTQQEANLARSQAQSLQQKLQQQEQQQNEQEEADTRQGSQHHYHHQQQLHQAPVTSSSSPLLAPIEQLQSQPSVLATPTLQYAAMAIDSSFSVTHVLVQTLAATTSSSSSIIPWLLTALPCDATIHQVCACLMDRFVRHTTDLEALTALYYALLLLPPVATDASVSNVETTTGSRISVCLDESDATVLDNDPDAVLTDNNNGLFLQAQRALLQQDGTGGSQCTTAAMLTQRLVPTLLQLAETSNATGWLSLQVLALIFGTMDSYSGSMPLPAPGMIQTFCDAATMWLRELTSSATHNNSNDVLRQRCSIMVPMDEPDKSPDKAKNDDSTERGTVEANQTSSQGIQQPMTYLIAALPILTIAARRHGHQQQPLQNMGGPSDSSDETDAWTRTVLAAVLDVLEAIMIRYWKLPGDDEDGSLKIGMAQDQVMAFCGECVFFFQALALSEAGLLLLRTQMATTHSTNKEWNRGVSAIALAEALLNNIVIQQHKNDHVFDYSETVWNPIRDAVVRLFQQLLRSVEIQTIRYNEGMSKAPKDGQAFITFSTLLSECLDLYIGAAALLANVTESSSVKVDKDIDTMLRMQLAELSADEEDLDA